MNKKIKYLVLLVSIVIAFIISLSVYLVKIKDSKYVLAFYPAYEKEKFNANKSLENKSDEIIPELVEQKIIVYSDIIERKELPKMKTKEENLSQFLTYYSFGPSTSSAKHLEAKLVYPKGIKPNSIILRKKTLYIDYPYDFIIAIQEADYDLKTTLSYLEKNISYNFRGIEKFLFTVGGKQVILSNEDNINFDTLEDDMEADLEEEVLN